VVSGSVPWRFRAQVCTRVLARAFTEETSPRGLGNGHGIEDMLA